VGYSDAYLGGYGAGSTDVVTGFFIETDPDDWYDATAFLISGNITRGRQNELDEYQAGVCDVLLDNDLRTFDPTYASSPLNGHILPMKRVKLVALYDGESYPLFFGYADRWTQNRDGPHRGTTSLQATDGFKVLARATLASSAFAQEVLADGPVAWWRFNESGAPAFDSVGSVHLDTVDGAPVFGEDPLISRDPGTAVTLTTADGLYRYGTMPVHDGPLTLEVVAKFTDAGTVFAAFNPAENTGFALDGSAGTGFQVATGVGSAQAAASSVTYADNATHHIVGVWEPGSAGSGGGHLRIYVDGVETTIGTPQISESSFHEAGWTMLGRSPLDTTGIAGTVDEVVIYNTALSAARIAAHHETISTPWDGDLPGERIERVLDGVGWPDTLRDIDPGTTVLQSAELDMPALEHLQKVARTEYGNLYVEADGTIRFEDRTSAVNQPVLYTFSDEPGGDLPITFSNPELADDQIRNDVTVSRLEGTAQNARDQASIATYQQASYTLDRLYHDNDDHSRNLAEFILAGYATPVERVSQMVVNPYRDPAALWPVILAAELTDRVVLNETPQLVTPEVSRTLTVEGVGHAFGPKAWSATFNLSENTAAVQPYWQIGVAGYSEIGETTRVYF
jgi:hypothetical protein